MAPIVHFKCRACEGEIMMTPSRAGHVACPHCKRDTGVLFNDSLLYPEMVTACVSCGHDAFYVQKDFNRGFGIFLVVAGILVSVYFYSRGRPMSAMAVLGITALVDFLLHSLVGDVTVCYSCHALYRGFRHNPEHEAFDLKKLEKYGGRTPRTGH